MMEYGKIKSGKEHSDLSAMNLMNLSSQLNEPTANLRLTRNEYNAIVNSGGNYSRNQEFNLS